MNIATTAAAPEARTATHQPPTPGERRSPSDGNGAPSPGSGHGLVGMRERAALYGGTVETGGLPAGGYRVRARLAVDGVPA